MPDHNGLDLDVVLGTFNVPLGLQCSNALWGFLLRFAAVPLRDCVCVLRVTLRLSPCL